MSLRRFILFLTLLVVALTALRLHYQLTPAERLQSFYGKQIVAEGRIVVGSVRTTDYGSSFLLEVEEISAAGRPIAFKERLRVSALRKNSKRTPRELACGRVRCSGELQGLRAFANPGAFDSNEWNFVNACGGRIVQAEVIQLDTAPTLAERPALFNLWLRQQLSIHFGDEKRVAALLCGMLLGGSQGLDTATREIFINNGLAHLLSVSGTHLMLLASFLTLILERLPQLRYRRLIILAALAVYALICGLRPSVLRALVMSVILGGGVMVEIKNSGVTKRADKASLLCLTASFLLLLRPRWLLDIGFQLSFTAAMGLLNLLPRLREQLRGRLPCGLDDAAAVTLAAQLAILPLEAGYFHQLPLISFVSNLLFIPLLEVAVLLTLVGALSLLFFSKVADIFFVGAAFLVTQVLRQGDFLLNIPYAVVSIPALPLWCGAVYYFLLYFWLDYGSVLSFTRRERLALLFVLALLLLGRWTWQLRSQPLTAYFLDVGQGDCTIIVSPDRQVAVIDCGGLSNYDTGAAIITPFLRRLGFNRIDILLLTHSDYDHVGGAAALARNLPVRTLILPCEELTSSGRVNLQPLLRTTAATSVTATVGQVFQLGGASLRIKDVPLGASGNEASTLSGLYDGAGKHCLLLPGDLGAEREAGLKNLGHWPLLKAGHHGSRNSSSAAFLRQVQPRLTIISCGTGNRYGHPHAETLTRLRAVGSAVMRTDQQGALKIVFDGNGLKCYSYKENSEAF